MCQSCECNPIFVEKWSMIINLKIWHKILVHASRFTYCLLCYLENHWKYQPCCYEFPYWWKGPQFDPSLVSLPFSVTMCQFISAANYNFVWFCSQENDEEVEGEGKKKTIWQDLDSKVHLHAGDHMHIVIACYFMLRNRQVLH